MLKIARLEQAVQCFSNRFYLKVCPPASCQPRQCAGGDDCDSMGGHAEEKKKEEPKRTARVVPAGRRILCSYNGTAEEKSRTPFLTAHRRGSRLLAVLPAAVAAEEAQHRPTLRDNWEDVERVSKARRASHSRPHKRFTTTTEPSQPQTTCHFPCSHILIRQNPILGIKGPVDDQTSQPANQQLSQSSHQT